ncbi:hypothetical protein CKK33_04145 [Mucilaginibacter sp. MD40]|uniref:FecR family protein n=1 Tax=Mucilaginibacter sp. MD40 TaxID=2029590 RepID=UPI000BAC7E31|nr:FecR family protein [Mucilaginibacter sp. MD40]PAW92729.1 hypothetical protein CKK33_04145 [Mucilaginibacter sp. MD40]
MKKDYEAHSLLKKLREGNCSEEELAFLRAWLNQYNQSGPAGLGDEEFLSSSVKMWATIDRSVLNKSRMVYIRRVAAIAASIIIVIAVGLIFWFNRAGNDASVKTYAVNHIKAGSNKATLTLANGETIDLEHAAKGALLSNDGYRAVKNADGQLVYQNTGGKAADKVSTAYNVLTVPFGGQYQLTLSDGTRVWINAGSTLHFPSRFGDGDRSVVLSGEAYFEVAHVYNSEGSRVRFTVKSGGKHPQSVEVLGTHFNISAYDNDDATKTTLLEGKVNIHAGSGPGSDKQRILTPGQQSIVDNADIKVVPADIEGAVAWKNGYFRFNDEPLESIMRKVERWYKVQVIFENERAKTKKFAGVINRFANVTELLKTLELTGEVHFNIDRDRIVVK